MVDTADPLLGYCFLVPHCVPAWRHMSLAEKVVWIDLLSRASPHTELHTRPFNYIRSAEELGLGKAAYRRALRSLERFGLTVTRMEYWKTDPRPRMISCWITPVLNWEDVDGKGTEEEAEETL